MEMEKVGKKLLEMDIDRGFENHFERRDGDKVVIELVARAKEHEIQTTHCHLRPPHLSLITYNIQMNVISDIVVKA